MANATSRTVPHFVKAKTPIGVRLAFEKASVKASSFLKPVSVNHVDGEWYIWYLDDLNLEDELLKLKEK